LKPRQTAKAARDPKPTSDRAVARTALRLVWCRRKGKLHRYLAEFDFR
jgi:hypothetical protein